MKFALKKCVENIQAAAYKEARTVRVYLQHHFLPLLLR